MTCDYASPSSCNPGPLAPSLAEMCNATAFIVFLSFLEELARKNDKISGVCERIEPIKKPDEEYDFVVVGGGAGGSVMAARLSEIHDWKVLLLEAGDDEPEGTEIPMSFGTLRATRIDWNYTTSNESHACLGTHGHCAVSSGKQLGGCTAHNAMNYIRGNPTDYNNWAALGNKGWMWEEVKPFYLKAEDNGEIERVGRRYHATGGPLSVQRFPYTPPFADSILAAAEQVGYGVSNDLNGEKLTGFTIAQTTTKHGVRRSSARAYLWPARNRKNLHISLNSEVTKVIIEKQKAVGVEYYKNGVLKKVRVKKEVTLSAGAIRSPHILLLSGIGPKLHLESVGVKVVKDLCGVGENFHDHATNTMSFTLNEPYYYDNDYDVASEYISCQTGPLSANGLGATVGAFATNFTTPDFPDVQMYFGGYNAICAPGEINALRSSERRTLIMRVVNLHTKSKGRISLASNDPLQYPVIWANYLGNPTDVQRLVKVTQMALALAKTKALQAHNFTLSTPPLDACSHHKFLSDEYWACAVQQGQTPELHYAGSCKMGPASDPMAVVDPRLRLHGIKGLRVVDASIIPQVTSGNTGAPTMMIGERGADFVKKDWGR